MGDGESVLGTFHGKCPLWLIILGWSLMILKVASVYWGLKRLKANDKTLIKNAEPINEDGEEEQGKKTTSPNSEERNTKACQA